jgi:hypothetical protein
MFLFSLIYKLVHLKEREARKEAFWWQNFSGKLINDGLKQDLSMSLSGKV